MRLVVLTLIALTATAQFKSTTQLVVETVTVKDKSGKPVVGLKASDFKLTEDGVPQEIRFFEFQQLNTTQATTPVVVTERAQPLARLTRGGIADGEGKYRDKRLLAIYFDLTAMQVPDQLRAFEAARSFVRNKMTAADLVAIMNYQGGAVQVLQDFTADRSKLLSVIETLIVGEDENAPADSGDASKSDTGAAFGQNDSEFNIFFTDRQLAALQTAASMLGRLNEKKSLLYFASGLRLNGTNNQAQLQATIQTAIRAGVSFWPIDARGLVASAPMGNATQGSPGNIGMYTGAAANAVTSNLQRSQDTLYTLAADTGGKAMLDSNDLERGIVNAQQSVESYYILGYYTTNANEDGKFRKVQITVTGIEGAVLDYRKGYFATKRFEKFTSADKERQLEDALRLGEPITDLTIAMEVSYFQLNRAEYYVPVVLKIPGSELALARKGGAEFTRIDFLGEIKDSYGSTITNLRDKVDIKLTGSTAAELSKRPIEYDTGFTLLPGKYRIKMLARDAETGRIGTYEIAFVIPNLNKETQRIPLSSVVLSSQRVEMKDALFNATRDKEKAAQLTNPLVHDGVKLIPSVTRVFRKTREMFVYLETYQQDSAETIKPMYAYVTFYRGADKVLETTPTGSADAKPGRLKAVPIEMQVPLESLEDGEYQCQVTVVDPQGKKTAFWTAPVMVIP